MPTLYTLHGNWEPRQIPAPYLSPMTGIQPLRVLGILPEMTSNGIT